MPSEFTREDYEHAARAAGLEVIPHLDRVYQHTRFGTVEWNPATDDGDALRLAVKLHLCVDLVQGADEVVAFFGKRVGKIRHFVIDASDEDRCRATRHAIFRAAIEIGKSMKGTP